ncbi:hypothetical protein [Methylobacterium sp. A54F]
MPQTIKPDRPIWPSVPEPDRGGAPQPGTGSREMRPGSESQKPTASTPTAAGQGFGTFAG